MAAPLYWLGRRCIRFRWAVLGTWVVVVLALVLWAKHVGSETSDNLTLPGSSSQQATDLLTSRFPVQANGTNPVVMKAPAGAKLKDKKYADAVGATVDSLRKDPAVASATSPLSAAGKNLLSKDGRIGYISLVLHDSPSELSEDEAHRIIGSEQPARDAGMQVATGGYLGQKVSKPEHREQRGGRAERGDDHPADHVRDRGGDGAADHHRDLGLAAGLSIIALLGQVVTVPTVAPTLATMIGLGVGIDYALFIVTRHKAQMEGGLEVNESIARGIATSGGAVMFAGGTVTWPCARCVRRHSAGEHAGLHGRHRGAGRRARRHHAAARDLAILGNRDQRAQAAAAAAKARRPPARLGALGERGGAQSAARRCVLSVALPGGRWRCRCWHMHLGQADTARCPSDTTARQANDLLSEGFGPGAHGPLLVSVGSTAPPSRVSELARHPAIRDFRACRRRSPRSTGCVGHAGRSSTAGHGGDLHGRRPPPRPGSGRPRTWSSTCAAPTCCRPRPRAGHDAPTSAARTAGYIDLAERIVGKLPLVIAIVVGARVPAADARVPLDRRAAQGGDHEPAVDRRRLRRDRDVVFQ